MAPVELLPAADELDEIGDELQSIMSAVRKIESNAEEIRNLDARSSTEVTTEGQRMIMSELERILVSSRRQMRTAKSSLDRLGHEPEASAGAGPGSTSVQIRRNLMQTQTMHFQQAANDYQLVSEAFKDSLRRRIRRQAEIFKPGVTEDQIEALILEPNQGKIFELAVAEPRSLNAALDIELDRAGMAKIADGITEIHDLFQDVASLIDVQQEQFDIIEQNVVDTAEYTAAAGQNLIQARVYQRSTRKKQLCMLLVAIVIATVVVLVVILGYFRR